MRQQEGGAALGDYAGPAARIPAACLGTHRGPPKRQQECAGVRNSHTRHRRGAERAEGAGERREEERGRVWEGHGAGTDSDGHSAQAAVPPADHRATNPEHTHQHAY